MAVQLLDGGLGTSLQDHYGVKFDSASTPLWSSHMIVSDPSTLLSCQRDFVAANVDVLLTATYQVSIEGFARTKTPEYPDGIPRHAIPTFLRTAVEVAEKAKTDRTAIALSLGPYGACMIPGQEYSGAYDAEHDSEEALFRWHLERLQLFVEADLVPRVQYVTFETLPRLDEIRAVRRAVHAASITAPFWIACVFPDETDTLPDGSSVQQVIQAALGDINGGATPWGVGINCTKIHKLAGLVEKFGGSVTQMCTAGQIPDLPSLVLYPDGTNGEVYNTTTQIWEKKEKAGHDSRPWEVQLAQIVRDARAKGQFKSYLVGGCCKASHYDIKKLGEQFRTD
ncbi:homocysteine S-methyltransferase family protein [Aspergillus melleus]|uniref:homocysteine S-methyltransferase family protein n=1 Tax=Aspergillus melleus TaxID=138277 RepID=UPI001E8E2050|nr:AdoMet-homocysteine methyltransferase [Aspergillus melleus]KAH8432982.1 AdoMet-homocysteine methyltransferase [Aspergillus melleus]